MMRKKKRPSCEVADVVQQFGDDFKATHKLPLQKLKALDAIVRCRTASLGGHKEKCDHCGHERISYNSCRNRHCPKCQALAKERWLLNRKQTLLPISYFHIVFTIPASLNRLALVNQRTVYNILFKASSQTLLTLAQDKRHLGAKIGFIAVLHTWGQNLMDHPHVHCIVTGGGLSQDGKRWVYPKKLTNNKDFFVHVNVISDLFKKKFLAFLKQAYQAGLLKCVGTVKDLADAKLFHRFVSDLYSKTWITYCKKSFGGPDNVLNYLGRYTHRVAISNHRIVNVDQQTVTFKWKDYKNHNEIKLLTLQGIEFIRRFLLHILPHGYFKIRYYGIFSNCNHKTKLEACKRLLNVTENLEDQTVLDWRDLFLQLTGIDLTICPHCGIGHMKSVGLIAPDYHAPPRLV